MRQLGRMAAVTVRVATMGTVGLLVVLGLGPRLLPFQVLYVRSGSMAPGMPIGSLAVMVRSPATALHPGDVIAFARPGRPGELVTHRIVRVTATPSGPQFVTKGDANAQPDPWAIPVTGTGWRRVTSVRGVGFGLGYLRAFLGTPWVVPAAAWASAALLVLRLWRPRRPQLAP